jgi:divalent metal cation (Fe/Co/Zn/Cd) transporter
VTTLDHEHERDHGHGPTPAERAAAVRRATLLNRGSLAYNAVEAVVALGAGVAAGSISLLAFGLDSIVEVSASLILAWRLMAERRDGCTQGTDRRATRAIAISFAVLALYVGVESVRRLASGEEADTTVIGIALTAVSVVLMPWLARAKRRVAPLLGSRAQHAEANQTAICALMSVVVLVGLLANATLGWWWADPLAGIGIAAIAAVEATRTWRAESLADTCCH